MKLLPVLLLLTLQSFGQSPLHIETVVDKIEPGIYYLGILVDIDPGYKVYTLFPLKNKISLFKSEITFERLDVVRHYKLGEYGQKKMDENDMVPSFRNHVYYWDKIIVKDLSTGFTINGKVHLMYIKDEKVNSEDKEISFNIK
jgi:hypothetical protein